MRNRKTGCPNMAARSFQCPWLTHIPKYITNSSMSLLLSVHMINSVYNLVQPGWCAHVRRLQCSGVHCSTVGVCFFKWMCLTCLSVLQGLMTTAVWQVGHAMPTHPKSRTSLGSCHGFSRKNVATLLNPSPQRFWKFSSYILKRFLFAAYRWCQPVVWWYYCDAPRCCTAHLIIR